jgi:hypothetical protein
MELQSERYYLVQRQRQFAAMLGGISLMPMSTGS